MNAEDVVTITSRGMITIPLSLRKRFNLKPGTQIAILEDEGKLALIPLVDIEQIRETFPTLAETSTIFDKSRKEELELER
ncbi:MAG: hypothetical protein RBG13Loki_4391 [Promethearchaeota archaeon CR_4]|nr:MAG: hypothetical protein RBG13Loki_4391 [Candidatus Lokiarchaeota archaeon CR_4]